MREHVPTALSKTILHTAFEIAFAYLVLNFSCSSVVVGVERCENPYGYYQNVSQQSKPEAGKHLAQRRTVNGKALLVDLTVDITKIVKRHPGMNAELVDSFNLKAQCERLNPCPAVIQNSAMMLLGSIANLTGAFDTAPEADKWLHDNGVNWSWSKVVMWQNKLSDEIEKKYPPDRLRAYVGSIDSERIAQVIEQAKTAVIALIERYPGDRKTKTDMASHVRAIKTVSCDALLEENATYDDKTNSVCIGLGMLDARAVVMVLAHEIGHSIDPCQSKTSRRPYPFASVIKCLRTAESVGAVNSSGTAPVGLCDSSFTDQIGESFADWVAAEVTREVMVQVDHVNGASLRYALEKDYSWMWESKQRDQSKFNEHPTLKNRLNKIAFANPSLRDAFGCTSTSSVPYCGISEPRINPSISQKPNGAASVK